MSEMYPTLPERYQFETRLYTQGKTITDDFLLKAEWLGDGLSSNEFDRPFEQLWEAAGSVARYVTYPDERIDEVQKALYRGVSFGYDVVETLMEGVMPASVASSEYPLEYMGDIVTLAQPKEHLFCDTADFLDTHPYAADVIATSLPQINTAPAYQHHARRAAAMVLMTCEEGYARLHAEFSARHRARGDILGTGPTRE